MRKLVVIVTAATALLLAGGLASNAQTSRGAANIMRRRKLHADRESRLRAVFWRTARSIPSLGLRSLWPLRVRPLLIATGPTNRDT